MRRTRRPRAMTATEKLRTSSTKRMSGSMTPTTTTPVVDALSTAAADMGMVRDYDRSSPLESPGNSTGQLGGHSGTLAQATGLNPEGRTGVPAGYGSHR